MKPIVSFIIPVYNSIETISDSLLSALQQDWIEGHIELVVVDDCSSDGTLLLLERFCDEINRGVYGPFRSMILKTARDIVTIKPHGPAAARNRAAKAASGSFFCLLDSDDICRPNRIRLQMKALINAEQMGQQNILVGARFTRLPENSSPTYSSWANSLTPEELYLQSWRECTLVQPTWFMRKEVFERIGGYDEISPPLYGSKSLDEARWNLAISENISSSLSSSSILSLSSSSSSSSSSSLQSNLYLDHRHPPILSRSPLTIEALCLSTSKSIDEVHPKVEWFGEDPIFFHRHLQNGGKIILADKNEPLLIYRFSSGSVSWKTPRSLLQQIRVSMFEEAMLFSSSSPFSKGFSIWGAGRDGKLFYNALSPHGKRLVTAFCDIDKRKIGQRYPQEFIGKKRKWKTESLDDDDNEVLEENLSKDRKDRHFAPIVHLSKASLPVICCVNLESGGQELRSNAALYFPDAKEGIDLIYFI